MKTYNFIFLLILFICNSCKKDDSGVPVSPVDPISQLPLATNYGANTIGCLINGKVFLPKGDDKGSIASKCVYGNHFYIAAYKNTGSSLPNSVLYVMARNIKFEEGKTYPLELWGENKADAQYTILYNFPISYDTDNRHRGELKITKLDTEKQIISGTFWFDARDQDWNKIEVREGRFDMKYEK